MPTQNLTGSGHCNLLGTLDENPTRGGDPCAERIQSNSATSERHGNSVNPQLLKTTFYEASISRDEFKALHAPGLH